MSASDQGLEAGLEDVEPGARRRLVAFRLVLLVAGQLRARMDRLLAPLTTQQAALLSVVAAMGRPSFGEVAAVLSTSHQNVKQIALGLERQGLLRIATDDEDRRVRRLEPTQKNRALWARRNPADHAVTASWFAQLSDVEIQGLVRSLRRLRQGLDGDGGVGTAPPPRARAGRATRRRS